MPNVKKITLDWSETGKTVYSIIRREADSFRLNDADGTFATAPADPYLSLTEDSVIKGRYEVSESRTAWNDGRYSVAVYRQAGGSPAPASDTIIGTGEIVILSDTEVYQTGDVFARLGAPAGASVSADILVIDNFVDELETRLTAVRAGYLDNLSAGAAALEATSQAILTDTAVIGVAGAGLTAIPWNIAWDAEVQSECTDALNAYDPPTKAEMDTAFTEVKGATWSSVTDTLEALRDRGDAAWITATGFSTHTAADTWAVATRTLTAGTNIVLAKGAGVTGFNDIAATDVWASATRTLTSDEGGVKKNTTLNNFEFLMVDSIDNKTGKTGLVITATRSIDGAAFGACANAVSEVSNGIYKINLANTDLNGDIITFRFAATGANDRLITIKTVV